jgi:hypothetical protein
MTEEEIKRVRGLKTDGQLVEKRIRLHGQLNENDSVMKMGNVAEKNIKQAKKAWTCYSVGYEDANAN